MRESKHYAVAQHPVHREVVAAHMRNSPMGHEFQPGTCSNCGDAEKYCGGSCLPVGANCVHGVACPTSSFVRVGGEQPGGWLLSIVFRAGSTALMHIGGPLVGMPGLGGEGPGAPSGMLGCMFLLKRSPFI